MKKFYNEPEMNISLFTQADVVTTSGEGPVEPQGMTAETKAMNALKASGAANTVVKVTF